MPRKKEAAEVTDQIAPASVADQLAGKDDVPVSAKIQDAAVIADKVQPDEEKMVAILARRTLPQLIMGKQTYAFVKGRRYEVPESVAYHLMTIDAA